MSENHSVHRGRLRRAERAQHIYSMREFAPAEEQPDVSVQTENFASYMPNEEPVDEWNGYTPNKETETTEWSGYTPNETDFSAYYSREAAGQEVDAEPAFAPPPKMDQYLDDNWADEEVEDTGAAGNVYHTRSVSWDDDTEELISESELGYQVQEEKRTSRKHRHALRNLLIILLVLAVLCGAAWFFREPLMEMTGLDELIIEPTEEPFQAVVTPEPVKAYDAAQKTEVADGTRSAISHLSGTLDMETFAVTDANIITRNQRANGTYDFYVFTSAEGRLLNYFEGLGPQDLLPQDGGFYVAQSPYLITAKGAARIRTDNIEAQLGEKVFLHPLYRGWAIVESEADGSSNYVNLSGELINPLWFARSFPFTGDHTLAYVDTGATDQRYLLYVLSADGTVSRWLACDDMTDVVGSACSMTYTADGSVYHLPDTSAPIAHSSAVSIYPDCDAMVVCDSQTGKYGLFVRGEQHYDFAYDSIRPVDSDIVWETKTLDGPAGSLTICAASGISYPQPLSHSFVLEKNGQREYVALSTLSSYPIRLDGEF